jgi:hypothetical protein
MGFSSGQRCGSQSRRISNLEARCCDILAVWQGSSSRSSASGRSRYLRRNSARKAQKSAARPCSRQSSTRCPVRRLMVPKITRRAFRPVMETWTCLPRGAQPARSGGKSSTSVSSSASTRHRAGKCCTCRRRWRFFLSGRVRIQRMARTLPGAPLAIQFAPQRVVRHAEVHPGLQMLAQQRHCPPGRPVAQCVRTLLQAPRQELLHLPGPQGGSTSPAPVRQRSHVAPLDEPPDPVVERLPRHAERHRRSGHGHAAIQLQERDRAPNNPSILGAFHQDAKPLALPRGQPKAVHGCASQPQAHPSVRADVKLFLRRYLGPCARRPAIGAAP